MTEQDIINQRLNLIRRTSPKPRFHYVVIKGMDMDELIEQDENLDHRSPIFNSLEQAKEYMEELQLSTDFSDPFEWQYWQYRIVKITTVNGDKSEHYKLRRYV